VIPYIVRSTSSDSGPFLRALNLNREQDYLVPSAGNSPPPRGTPYLCIVPVHDYWRLSQEMCRKYEVAHFASLIDPEVEQNLRQGQALIVMDLSNEGVPLDVGLFECFHEWLDHAGVSGLSAFWINQNRRLAEDYATHFSRSRPQLMRFGTYDYFIKMTAHDLASGSGVAAEIPVDNWVEEMFAPRNKTHSFLCLNATPRPHRVFALGALRHYGLLDSMAVSFPGLSYEKGSSSPETVMSVFNSFENLSFMRDDVESACLFRDLRVDTFTSTGNALWNQIDPAALLTTFASLVTETEMSSGNVRRISEKSIKSLGLGHPTVILGNPGSLQIARDLGFDDWSSAIDASYDLVTDPGERLLRVMQELLRIESEIRVDPARWLKSARDAGQSNFEHGTDGLLHTYVQRCERPLLESLSSVLANLSESLNYFNGAVER
jgi:hypothetical protein